MIRPFSLARLLKPETALFFLCLFFLVFPKGGIKLGPAPLTWGYFFLGVTAWFVATRKAWGIHPGRLWALICLFPFQILSLGSILWHGAADLGFTISFFITFFFTPYVFLFLFSKDIETMDLERFFSLFKKGIAFISYYGIFLFVYKQLVGKYLEIPLLTTNLGDFGALDHLKCNSRGVVSKLISTYNNGQLFGISISMLLPLYCLVQNNRWHRWATKLAILLTLSRTAWIGLLFHEIFYNLLVEKSKKKMLLSFSLFAFLFLLGLLFLSWRYGFRWEFFFDQNFGGRRAHLAALERWTYFPSRPFSSLSEMVYVAILDFFGAVGLGAYLFAMGGPLLAYWKVPFSKPRLCVLLGLVNYLFISISDGATLYIPVLTFYWFLVSLLTRKDLLL